MGENLFNHTDTDDDVKKKYKRYMTLSCGVEGGELYQSKKRLKGKFKGNNGAGAITEVS